MGQHLVTMCARRYDRPRPALSGETLRWMQAYEWPGNIRELENWVIRYVLMGAPELRAAFDSKEPMPGMPSGDGSKAVVPLKEITKNVIMEAERALILKTLELHHWNRRRTAETLKVSYRALIYKIRQVGLPSKRLTKRAVVAPIAIAPVSERRGGAGQRGNRSRSDRVALHPRPSGHPQPPRRPAPSLPGLPSFAASSFTPAAGEHRGVCPASTRQPRSPP